MGTRKGDRESFFGSKMYRKGAVRGPHKNTKKYLKKPENTKTKRPLEGRSGPQKKQENAARERATKPTKGGKVAARAIRTQEGAIKRRKDEGNHTNNPYLTASGR